MVSASGVDNSFCVKSSADAGVAMTQRTASARPSREGGIGFMGFLCMVRVSHAHYGIEPIM
jgi:hypothetical protein